LLWASKREKKPSSFGIRAWNRLNMRGLSRTCQPQMVSSQMTIRILVRLLTNPHEFKAFERRG
jgi:hypothetical protein